MPNPVILAQSKIGDHSIVIELIKDRRKSGSVKITWPTQPISISETRFPDVAASITRLFANAAMTLAQHKAGDRL